MALAKDTNSYVTRDEADAYFADRLDVAAWTEAPVEQKDAALITATSLLDSLEWIGVAVSESQPLCFPRSGEYFDPRLGYDIYLDEQQVPSRIITATYELAYHLLNNDGLLDSTGAVKELQLGSINLRNILQPEVIPYAVKRYIQPLLEKSSSTWWRAN